VDYILCVLSVVYMNPWQLELIKKLDAGRQGGFRIC